MVPRLSIGREGVSPTSGETYSYFQRFTATGSRPSYLESGWKVTRYANGGAADTFEFTLRDVDGKLLYDEGQQAFFTVRDLMNREVILWHTDYTAVYLFGGTMTEINVTTLNPSEVILKCTARGWAHLLEDVVVSSFYPRLTTQGNIIGGFPDVSTLVNGNVVEEGRAYPPTRSIFHYVEGGSEINPDDPNELHFKERRNTIGWRLYRTNIYDGLQVASTTQFRDKTIRSIITDFARNAGFIWRVDPDKAVHFKPPNQEKAGDGTNNITFIYGPEAMRQAEPVFPNYPYHKFSQRIDVSKLKNHVVVIGGRARSSEQRREYLNGDGVTKEFELVRQFGPFDPEASTDTQDGKTPRVLVWNGTAFDNLRVANAFYDGVPGVLPIGDAEEYDVIWDNSNARYPQLLTFSDDKVPPNIAAAVIVSSYDFETRKGEESLEPSIEAYGRKTLVVTDENSERDQERLERKAYGLLYEHGQDAEVLRLSVLADTTSSTPTNVNAGSKLLRYLDAGKTVIVNNTLHNVESSTDYLIEQLGIEHLNGHIYECRLTLRRVYPELLPESVLPLEDDD